MYLYIRYSHEKQGEGSSYDRQLGMARAYCPTLIEDSNHIFFDAGKSAFSGKNLADGGELKRFYDRVKSGLIPKGSTLLVEDLDRLSRAGMWKASDKLRELTENGITVHTLRDNRPYSGVLNLSDSLTALLKQELANDESAKKSGRVAESFVKRYVKAREGKKVKVLLPSWVKWVSDSEYIAKESEAGIVKEIFTMAAKGYSFAMICKDLNQRGIPPFRDRGKGKLWITASISAIVKGKAAIGEYAPNDGLPPIPDYFPPAVTVELFDAAQGARALRKGSGVTSYNLARFNVWSKVGLCAICKRPYHCVPKGRLGQLYLVCSGKVGGTCVAKNIQEKRSELAFLEILLNVVNADHFLSDQSKERQAVQALTGQIDAAEGKKQKLVQLLYDDPMPEVAESIRKVNAELERLMQEKESINSKLLERSTVERSRAAITAKINLEDKDSRIDANSLLKGLGIVVEIGRHDRAVSYNVYQGQDRKRILAVHDDGKRLPQSMAYSQDTAMRAYEMGDTDWPEMNISLTEMMREKAQKKLATEREE